MSQDSGQTPLPTPEELDGLNGQFTHLDLLAAGPVPHIPMNPAAAITIVAKAMYQQANWSFPPGPFGAAFQSVAASPWQQVDVNGTLVISGLVFGNMLGGDPASATVLAGVWRRIENICAQLWPAANPLGVPFPITRFATEGGMITPALTIGALATALSQAWA